MSSSAAAVALDGDLTLDDLGKEMLARYHATMSYVERLHRLLLDVIKDEFERLGISDVNSVQALLLFNIGDQEVTASELKTRGYYQGSNVSYNLKKLVETGYIHQEKCDVDRRAVRIRLTERGVDLRHVINALWARHVETLSRDGRTDLDSLEQLEGSMRMLERFWSDQIRYIY